MNDLKERGGFIVSADPFVQHDTSLSGNGTVNSPLGVMPGYNETVLWSGTPGTNSSGTLSEPVWNFERFKMHINALQGGEYVCEFSPTGTGSSRNYLTYGARGNNDCAFDICKWTFAENTFSAVSAKTFHSTWTSTSMIVENNQAAAKGYVSKIIGINRKQ